MPPSRYTPSWITSSQTTALIPPDHVYTTVTSPRTTILVGMDQPVKTASGIAVAKTRTLSARDRTIRNTADAVRRVRGPNRDSSRA